MKTLESSTGPLLYKPVVHHRQENRPEGRTHVCSLIDGIDLEGAVEALLDWAEAHSVRAEAILFGTPLAVTATMNRHQVMRDFMIAQGRSRV